MAILFGSAIMIIGAALQMAAQDCTSLTFVIIDIANWFLVAMFVVARLLLGFGIPFAIVAASSMIGELSYPKERAQIGSLFNASWFIG
jgi:MFS family permease